MPATRQLAAIMFADMVGYTALMNENEHQARVKRDRFVAVLQSNIDRFSGTLIQNYGDGSLVIFKSAIDGVKCAIHVQQQLQADPKVDLRVGLHTGDIIIDEGNVFGDGVNIASRIESLAVPGSVFISEKIFDDIKNQEEIKTQSLGFFELKNVKQPIQVYAISNNGVIVPSRDEVKGKLKTTLNSIAVLPFASLSSDPENEFFCDGMSEELINVLAQIDGLQVTSRTSAFSFKGKNADIREIAAQLNVQKIIEGSVRKAGNKVRITAQLINTADGYHLWSATYDRSIEDIFAVQDEIARAIANKLRTNLSTEEHESQLAAVPTENLEAYKKYLQGSLNWDSIQMEVRLSSVELLKEAVALEPHFANAHALLATIYSFPGIMGIMDAGEAKRLAAYHAAQAFKTQPENPRSLAAMAIVHLAKWEWDIAYDLLMKANRINSSEPAVYFALGEYYMLFLRFDKAAEVAKRTAEVDPMSARTLAEAARIYIYINKPDEAQVLTERSLLLNPQNFLALQMMGYIAYLRKDYDKAIRIFEENHKMVGDHPYALLSLALGYYFSGQLEKARAIQKKIVSMHEEHPEAGLEVLVAYLLVLFNEKEAFYAIFDKAVEAKNTWVIQMYGDSFNTSLRDDEHIIAARKKFGLPVFTSHSEGSSYDKSSVDK